MKSIFLFLSIFFCNSFLFAQDLTTPPDGGNKKAVVGERIGITDVTIHYDRPAVKGREGKNMEWPGAYRFYGSWIRQQQKCAMASRG
ncbi:MAG: hypothetical protein ABI784_07450 [Ginsengibacter sp.]